MTDEQFAEAAARYATSDDDGPVTTGDPWADEITATLWAEGPEAALAKLRGDHG